MRYRSFLMNMVSHYKRRKDLKIYLEIFLSLATIAAFSIFALRPTLVTIGELIVEIEAKKETLSTIDKKISNLKRAKQLYEQEEEKIILLDNAVPSTPQPDLLALQFEGVSSDNQIPIEGLSIGQSTIKGVSATNKGGGSQEKSKDPGSKLSFGFNTKSNYQALVSTIKSIQELQRLLDIDSVTLKAEDNETQVINLVVSGNAVHLNASEDPSVQDELPEEGNNNE